MNRLRLLLSSIIICISTPVMSMAISEYVTLERKEQGVYLIAFIDSKIIDASNDGYNSYCAQRWGLKGALNTINNYLKPIQDNQKPYDMPVALILQIEFNEYCKSIENKDGEIGPE